MKMKITGNKIVTKKRRDIMMMYEVGGVGSGQLVFKQLFFDWIFRDESGDYRIVDCPAKMQRDIINRLPANVQQEINNDIVKYNHNEAKKLLEQVNKDKPVEMVVTKIIDTNDSVRMSAKSGYDSKLSSQKSKDFYALIVNSGEPLELVRKLYASGWNRGWCADMAPSVQRPFGK